MIMICSSGEESKSLCLLFDIGNKYNSTFLNSSLNYQCFLRIAARICIVCDRFLPVSLSASFLSTHDSSEIPCIATFSASPKAALCRVFFRFQPRPAALARGWGAAGFRACYSLMRPPPFPWATGWRPGR